MPKTQTKKKAKKKTATTEDWRSWINTPSGLAASLGSTSASEEEREAARKRHKRLVRRRIKKLEGMLPEFRGKKRAAALHVLAWLHYILAEPGSMAKVRCYTEATVLLAPKNVDAWALLSHTYACAARNARYYVPGQKEIDDGLGNVTPLTGSRREKFQLRAMVMKGLATESVRCMREVAVLAPDDRHYQRGLRMSLALENEAERRLAKAERRPAEVTPMKTTGWKDRLLG